MNKLRRHRGSVLVLVAAGLVPLLGAMALAVDIGYFFVVRNQLQNAVDAAALAGAQGLFDQPGNYTDEGQAMRRAKEYASLNKVGGNAVTLASSEITFPESNVVKVEATRPAQTFFAKVLGVSQVNITATAAAIVAPVSGCTGGWRPFATVDQYLHGNVCVYPELANSSHGPFNPNPHDWKIGNVKVRAADYYMSPSDPTFDGQDVSQYTYCAPGSPTGFLAPRDVNGIYVRLENVIGTNAPGTLYQINLGADVQNNIVTGWSGTVSIGDTLTTMPDQRSLAGTVKAAVQQLIALDPNARLIRDDGNWIVWSDRYPVNQSPRLIPIIFTDPTLPAQGNGQSFRVANIGAFFLDKPTGSGHGIWGYFVPKRMLECVMVDPPERPARNTSGAAGRLLGSVRLVDPTEY